ncbi:MAG: hypothetical protein K2Y22_10160 [Candidatus Obscuribacterales bacterium]|nr:hypothetical protein [Candidatus Obscuribacterales bacterium]
MTGFKSKLAFVAVTIGMTIVAGLPALADDWRHYYRHGRSFGYRYGNPYYGAAYPYPYNPYYVSPYASPYPGYVLDPYPYRYRRDGVDTAVRILRSIGL